MDILYFSHHVPQWKLSLELQLKSLKSEIRCNQRMLPSLRVKSVNGSLGSSSWPTELNLVYIYVCV